MTENMKKFLETVSRSEELTTRMNGAGQAELIAMAKELGIELTEADFKQPAGELSDDELDAVVGGDKCVCALGGGGKKSDKSKACACVGGGGGEYRDGRCRCACVGGGVGFDDGLDWVFL